MRRFTAAALLLLTGCTAPPQPLPPPAPPETDLVRPSARDDGPIAGPRDRATMPEVSVGQGGRIGVGQPGLGPGDDADGTFTLDFADTDVHAVIDQILGAMLKVNYAVDPDIKGTATFRTAKPLPRALLLPTLEMLLNQNGATLVQSGTLYRVMPTKAATSSPALAGGSSAGGELVPLRYASAVELAKMLQPMVGQGGNGQEGTVKVVADAGHNALVISGDAGARGAVAALVRGFDTDMLAGQSFALFPVGTATTPRRMAADLAKLFQSDKGGALNGVVHVLPMDQANAVLVVAPAPGFIDDARRLFALIDRTRSQAARQWNVYYVQNGDCLDLATVLQRAFTPNDTSAATQSAAAAAAKSSASANQSQSQFNNGSTPGSGSGSTPTGGIGSPTPSASPTPAPAGGITAGGATATTASSASPATDSLSATSGESSDQGTATTETLRIVPSSGNNAILIYATPGEEEDVEAMLRRIDVQPLQVRIDATIAEVDLNDTLIYGTQFFLRNGGVNGLLTTGTSAATSTLTGLAPGFNLTAGKTGDAQGVLSALADVTNVRVLSSPQIMVLDNQPAHLLVGDLIPYLTQSSQSTQSAGAPVINNVSYRETGVILDVTPRITKNGMVTLDLSQEVSALGTTSETVGGQISPTFSDRQVHSKVVVEDGHTVGMAGLISDNISRENQGLPILKDIPYIGSLFSTQTNTRNRIELLVLITPHVERDQREIRALTEDLRRTLPSANLVPLQSRTLPASGSWNPNEAVTAP